jgi:hypothetical protein
MSSSATVGPAVAGRWYAADPSALRHEVSGLFDRAPERPVRLPRAEPFALVAPHAGFMFSGAVAAAAFREWQRGAVERVLLLGPSHYEAFDGGAVPAAGAYRTPLGDVAIDTEATARLAGHHGFRRNDRPFGPEHSLEAELPFLQVALPAGFRVVPVLLGAGTSAAGIEDVTDGLRPLIEPGTAIVVSSDFTHYGRGFGYLPFTGDVERRLRELDLGAVERIVAADRHGFDAYVARTGATICGRAAIAVLLRLLPEKAQGHLVAYDTSGRMTGDWTHTVSYASLLFAPGEPAC